MKTILDTIVDVKRTEIRASKQRISYSNLEESELFHRKCLSLKSNLQRLNFGIIAELKRKSPSAGTINENLDIAQLGKIYEENHVAGISCLTDNPFFGGSLEDLLLLRNTVNVPILRKEFIIDEYQIFESKAYGADVILLIAEILTSEEILHFTIMAQSLGMEVIVESHDKKNLFKINDSVDIVGINNRDLHLQKTTLDISRELYNYIPSEAVCISESGIKTLDQIIELNKIGYHGALIGESILNNKNSGEFLRSLNQLNRSLCL
jgi:indole-3-glycerol phosphate synthase